MNDDMFAWTRLAMSLALHNAYAAFGIGMPLLIVLAEGGISLDRAIG